MELSNASSTATAWKEGQPRLCTTPTWEEEHSQLAVRKGAEGKRCNELLAISSVLNVNQYKSLEESEPNSMFSFINQKLGNTAFDLTSSG